ncbi:MAG: LPS export ABC transporter permease LptF [Thiotrichales bacterium]|nr:MAG: LPS export ABC transporter permease LptF [Thiotrichales bacterium]
MSFGITIIDRYIIREVITTWLAVMFVLLIVVTSVEIVQFLKWFLQGELTTSTVLPLFINSQLKVLVLLIPVGLFLGVLLALSRLYMDSEMTAMMAGGIGPRQWFRSMLMVALPISLIVLVMMLFMRPWVALQRADINAQIRNVSIISTFAPGRFNRSPDGDAVIFMEEISKDGKTMSNIFQRFNKDGSTHIDLALDARNVTHENGLDYMMFENGSHYIGVPGESDYQIIDYAEYGVVVPAPKDKNYPLRVQALSTRALWNSDNPEHKAELDWRITLPVATLIIVMMALPLSQTTPRGGRYSKMALGILLYLVYSNLLGVGKAWISKGVVPFWVGTSWVHVLGLITLYALLRYSGLVMGRKRSADPDSEKTA